MRLPRLERRPREVNERYLQHPATGSFAVAGEGEITRGTRSPRVGPARRPPSRRSGAASRAGAVPASQPRARRHDAGSGARDRAAPRCRTGSGATARTDAVREPSPRGPRLLAATGPSRVPTVAVRPSHAARPASAAPTRRAPGAPRSSWRSSPGTSSSTRPASRQERRARPPATRRRDPAADRADTRPSLLLHGFIDNRSVFVLLRRSLARHGRQHVESLNYSPLTCDIRTAAELLGRHIEEICERTGQRAGGHRRAQPRRADRALLRAAARRRRPGPHARHARHPALRHPRRPAG